MEHEAGKGEEMQAGQDVRQTLIVTRQPPEAGGPGEPTLDHPPLGEQDEAAFGLGQLDDLQADAVGCSGVSRFRAGVALVDVGELDGLAGGLLHRGGQCVRPGHGPGRQPG